MKLLSNFLIFFLQSVHAVDSCNERDPQLFFANGMFNSREAARASADALAKIVPPESASALPVELAYNINENALEQLLEVTRQKSSEVAAHFWRFLGDMSLASEDFRKTSTDMLFNIEMFEYEKDEDLRRHIEIYNKTLMSARSVVIVAHSQGNLYAMASLGSAKLVPHSLHRSELLSVAAPILGGFKKVTYTTLEQDQIMNTARVVTGGYVLPGNVRNSRSTLIGHNFTEDYLNGDKSGKKIASELATFLIKDPAPDTGEKNIHDPATLHSSLIPFWFYFNKVLSAPEKSLSRTQCLALKVFTADSWGGQECSQRSLDGMFKFIESCRTTWLNNKVKYMSLNCGVFAGDPIHLGTIDFFVQDLLETKHPECLFVRLRSKKDIITDADIDGAKKLLKNPL